MSEEKARDAALRLISYRPRSEHELRVRLNEKSFDEDVIEVIVGWLKDNGSLDDENFASELVSSRVRNKCWGLKKIAFDLRKKGISEELIKKTLAELVAPTELETAIKALNKWTRKRGLALPLDETGSLKAHRHLSSLGFSSGVAFKALKEIETETHDI